MTQQHNENIHQRILNIMQEIKYIQKEDKKVNGQYSFVSHDAVTSKLRPLFIKHRVLTIPRVISFDTQGNRTCVAMEVDFVNVDKPEDRIVVAGLGHGIDNQDKGPGKAMSYAVKYIYLKVFDLETGDDPERDSINYAESESCTREPDLNEADRAISEKINSLKAQIAASKTLKQLEGCYRMAKRYVESNSPAYMDELNRFTSHKKKELKGAEEASA